MQVMPATARAPGFGIAPARSDSPQEFNRVGQAYLKVLHQRYGGDTAKMWAAYNAGPGRVDAALQAHGPNWLQALPSETQSYVAQNLRAIGG
jgi:soluble lytic murein transglycosylase